MYNVTRVAERDKVLFSSFLVQFFFYYHFLIPIDIRAPKGNVFWLFRYGPNPGNSESKKLKELRL